MPLWTDPQALAELQAAHTAHDQAAADRWMRAALAELVPAQARGEAVVTVASPPFELPVAVNSALQASRTEQPGPAPAGLGLALLLRGLGRVWEEEQELDWAIRYWEAARKAGIAWSSDFGECWRQIEFSAVELLLGQLGSLDLAGEQALPRFALLVRSCTRYREIAPLLPLLEQLRPGVTQRAFG